jgi:heavy metal translocating P-type ATPase
MWCPSCAWVIDATLTKAPGVFRPACRFATDTFQCDYDPVVTSPGEITRRIEQLGYSAHTENAGGRRQEDRREFIRLAVSAFLTMNVMMLSWALYGGFFSDLGAAGIRFLSIPILLMSAVVFFYGGANIHGRGWRSLALGAYGMETLIAIGASIVFAYSTWGMIEGSLHLYFDTSSMLITLVLLGKMLERRAKDSARKDLSHFLSMAPRKARICTEENMEGRYVAIEQLSPGDLFRLTEGEVAPADGTVVSGRGAGDESALTGESKPKRKTEGDTVVSGTRLVRGDLVIRALHVGADSTLGQMIRLMETALGGKTPVEAQMDRLLRWFVPGVIFLALATAAVLLMSGTSLETALLRMITVLVVSCPCALGIAIPLTRSVGIAAAGRKGLLVRDAAAFDRARGIGAVIFDKTGTLTTGHWRLLEIRTDGSFTEAEVLALAAGLEQGSDNAAALAILRHARERGISPDPVTGIEDYENGRTGIQDERKLRLGSDRFMQKAMTDIPPSLAHPVGTESRTISRVYLGLSGKVIATFIFGDDIRPDADDTVKTLRGQGFRLGMVSGDSEASTRRVAEALDVREWQGGMLPEEKMRFVEKWQKNPMPGPPARSGVAVVGDGVNDAPALARSDLGVAVKAGAPLGKEIAHVTLMRGELSQVTDFLDLAAVVQKKIRQNLTLTVLYNAVSIPIAMAGILSPLVAVCAMLLSSLSVIGNTILLNRVVSGK